MGSFSLTRWLVVLAIVLIVCGAGRLPGALGELARGVRAFRRGMRDDAAAARPVGPQPAAGDLR
jgi:sec-independent protein translocase protein TatA